jgi:hypothetical protein
MSEKPEVSEPPDEETPGVDRKEMGGPALALENARLPAELAQRERLVAR